MAETKERVGNFEQIKLEIAHGVAVLTLDRPEKMNAFTGKMMQEIIAAFDITDADDSVRAVIMTGSGDRAFCAGADLSEGAKTFDYEKRADSGEAGRVSKEDMQRDGGGRVTLRIYDSLKPVIGAINGAAVGIGVTMQFGLRRIMRGLALCLTAAGLIQKRRRAGSCRAWWVSLKRWNGAILGACFLPRRR